MNEKAIWRNGVRYLALTSLTPLTDEAIAEHAERVALDDKGEVQWPSVVVDDVSDDRRAVRLRLGDAADLRQWLYGSADVA